MRYTLLLVAALGLIATAAPAVLAQETTQPTTYVAADQAPTPALAGPIAAPPISSGCCQPVMPTSCCQPVMQTSCCQAGGYPYGSPYAAPAQTYSSRRGLFRGRNRANEMPVYASYYTPYQSTGIVTAGVQQAGYSSAACCGGTTLPNPPIAGGMMTAGMIAPQPIQSGVVYQTGAMGPYSNQPVTLGGYDPSYGYAPAPGYAPGGPGYGYGGYGYGGGYDFGRPGYNPGGLGGPRSGLGVRPGMGFGGFGLRR